MRTHSRIVLLVVAYLLGAGKLTATANPEYSTAFTPDDIIRVAHIANLSISPDGRWVTYAVRRGPYTLNTDSQTWWLVPTDGSAGPRQLPVSTSGPLVWRPDSNAVVYLKHESDGAQILIVEIPTFHARALTKIPLADAQDVVSALRWSPDTTGLAYLVQPATTPVAGLENSKAGIPADVSWAGNSLPAPQARPRSRQLWRMDLASGTRKLLAPDSLHVTSFDWSADSQFIAYTAYPEPPSGGYDWLVNATIGGVFITGTGGEEPRLLAPLAPAISDFVRFSSDGRWLSYNTGTGIFVCTTNPAEGIKPKQVVDAASIPSWTRVFWSTDSDSLFLQTRGELTQSVELVRMRGLIREPVLKGGQFYREFAVSANSRIFVATVEGVSDPAQIIVGTLPSGTIRTLVGDDMLNPHLAKLIRPSAERIVWRSKDNKWDIQGILIKPPGWQPNQRYPLLVGIMGGPSPVNMEFDVGDAYFSPILFASHGYFVLYPMTRGRAGAGRGFAHAINDEQSELENPLQDALRGEEVLVEQGLADSRRLAVMGGSYGGRLVAYATTRTDRFRAAINWEGIRLNLLGQLFDGWGNAMARRYLTDLPISAAANPYDAVGRTQLELLSPIYHAQNIKTPTLCLYGINSLATKDGRPWFQALQYFGIPSELIVYPRTGHGIREAVLMRDSYTRELAWFDYWLKDERYPNTEAQQEYDAWRRHMIKTNDPRWISSHPSG